PYVAFLNAIFWVSIARADDQPSTKPITPDPANPTSPNPPTEPPPPEKPPASPQPATLAAPELRPVEEEPSLARVYNEGFQWGISPGFIIPSSGSAAFVLSGTIGYGVSIGWPVLVPNLHAAAYFTDPSIWAFVPGAKMVFPIGDFGPFLGAGFGPVIT